MAQVTEQQILETLKGVVDPDRKQDIVSLDMVSGLIVKDGNLTIARNQDRFVPISEEEIRLYSSAGGHRCWPLPEKWRGREFELKVLSDQGLLTGPTFDSTEGQIRFQMQPKEPYMLRLK